MKNSDEKSPLSAETSKQFAFFRIFPRIKQKVQPTTNDYIEP